MSEDVVVAAVKQSSVEVSQNSKGQYAFKAKIYYDTDEREGEDVVKAVKSIFDTLHSTFV